MQHSPENDLAMIIGAGVFVLLLILRQGFFALISWFVGEDISKYEEDQGYDFPDPRRFK